MLNFFSIFIKAGPSLYNRDDATDDVDCIVDWICHDLSCLLYNLQGSIRKSKNNTTAKIATATNFTLIF